MVGVPARLLWPTHVIIEIMPRDILMDDDFRTPQKSRQQLKQEGFKFDTRKIKAQVVFGQHELMDPAFTGDEATTSGRLVITAKTQKKYSFRPGDFVTYIWDRKVKSWLPFELKILQVRPRAHKGFFRFYHLNFEDESKA